ncbi:MAG: ATP-binding protein [Magnetococcales bacterium]|nr:ATP-binding protein [Magnetococcales bacterium]
MKPLDAVRTVGESLKVEFKSDQKPLADRDLVAAVVALTNTEGGDLYLGIEDDGTVTGLHANHQDLNRLSAMIAARTIPSVSVRTEILDSDGLTVARILVPKSRHLVATSDGLLQRRRLQINGRPEAVPFYPHEFSQRQASLGLVDHSARPMPNLPVDALSSLERQRIRDAIQRHNGDAALLALGDEELDGALGLTITTAAGIRCPTLAGLLMIGREDVLRQYLPAHETDAQAYHLLKRMRDEGKIVQQGERRWACYSRPDPGR